MPWLFAAVALVVAAWAWQKTGHSIPGVPQLPGVPGGPPIPGLPPSSNVALNVAVGAMSAAVTSGGTISFTLPTGGQWGDWSAAASGQPDIPVTIPAGLTASLSGGTSGANDQAILTGVTGSGTVTLAWVDASDAQQYTQVAVTSS